jgi:hypothetical protein
MYNIMWTYDDMLVLFFLLENILSCHENLSKINYMTWMDYIFEIFHLIGAHIFMLTLIV